eukprot:6205808-Pleurochrysis_carterae.AAC.1
MQRLRLPQPLVNVLAGKRLVEKAAVPRAGKAAAQEEPWLRVSKQKRPFHCARVASVQLARPCASELACPSTCGRVRQMHAHAGLWATLQKGAGAGMPVRVCMLG